MVLILLKKYIHDYQLNKYKVKYTQKMADNQIIAEFMGYTEKNKKIKEIYNQEAEVKSFSYHTSWDWLMPVANEIIKSRDEQNADWDLTNLKYALQTTNIEYVYKAVVEFINEYNKRK